MYQILIVDDEPLICKGLSSLLASSGLGIDQLYTAHNAYDALDYLRMEDIDLLITDIQMEPINGIELMQQAKIIKPWVLTVIISAHETFHYAQTALRLGAKDYLIKPLKNEQFLRTVRSALLGLHKPTSSRGEVMSNMKEHYQMATPQPQKNEFLNRLLTQGMTSDTLAPEEAVAEYGIRLSGPYYAVIRIRLCLTDDAEKDHGLLQYAGLNIAGEVLGQEWEPIVFYSPGGEISILLQWSEESYQDNSIPKLHQLDTVGRSLYFNIHKYLRRHCIVGISQVLRGVEFLPVLGTQAYQAMEWHREYQDHFVFYYGDFKWNVGADEDSHEEWTARNSMIVGKAKEYIDANYSQKGLTLQEVAHRNHVSPNYLSYLFKKLMGCNLWEYVIRLRMEESRRLLLQTDLRRYEIAERVGYESPEHFSKIFKKYYGISPTDLKK